MGSEEIKIMYLSIKRIKLTRFMQYACCISFVLYAILFCTNPKQTFTQPDLNIKEIKGFRLFDIYQKNNLLGFIPSGENRFNFKIWEGIVRKSKIRQVISKSYSVKDVFKAGAGFKMLFSAKIKNSKITKINIKLINPVEYILENPAPAVQYEKRADFLGTKYIGSILKVEKILINVFDSEGRILEGGAILPYISPEAEYKTDVSGSSLQTGEDVFIGYKLFVPPENPENLIPFTFEYQILHQSKKAEGWRLLQSHDTIRTGDYIKIRFRSSHPVYLYLLNIDSGNNTYALFPREDIAYRNPLEAGKIYFFPEDENKGFEVDDVKGIEEFLFLLSREDSDEINLLLKKVKKEPVKRETLENISIVSGTRGLGKIAEIKKTKNKKSNGFELPVHVVKGLPSNYKESFVLTHK
jgi:hypothetical protein